DYTVERSAAAVRKHHHCKFFSRYQAKGCGGIFSSTGEVDRLRADVIRLDPPPLAIHRPDARTCLRRRHAGGRQRLRPTTWSQVRIEHRSAEQRDRVRATEDAACGHRTLVLAPHGGRGSIHVRNGASARLEIRDDLAIPHAERIEDGPADKVPVALLRRAL